MRQVKNYLGAMKRTINVVSNLVYAVVGVVAVTHSGFTPFAFACFALAVGSGLFHYYFDHDEYSYYAHHADELAMYMVFSSIIGMLYGFELWLVMVPVWITLHFVALRFSAHQVLGVMAVTITSVMLFAELYMEVAGALILFAYAYYVRSTDDFDFEHGHAHWHLTSGVMVGVLYWFILTA